MERRRERYVEEHRPERTLRTREQLRGNDMRKQLDTKNSKTSNEGRQDKMVELREETGVQRSSTERPVRCRLQWKGWRMTDYRRERQSYVSNAGGDEGGHGRDGRTVLREM